MVADPPPEGRDEDEDVTEEEDREDADDSGPAGVGFRRETAFFPFCLYHRPRVAAASPGSSPAEIARLLAAEWRELPQSARAEWRVPQAPRTRARSARGG